tara:strand:- start:1298 stop:1438 length:141 start_codon:yes stop_codon:yes gene_type:complete
MYYGRGFNHADVYNMPVYLRQFYINLLIKTKKEEQAEEEKRAKRRR